MARNASNTDDPDPGFQLAERIPVRTESQIRSEVQRQLIEFLRDLEALVYALSRLTFSSEFNPTFNGQKFIEWWNRAFSLGNFLGGEMVPAIPPEIPTRSDLLNAYIQLSEWGRRQVGDDQLSGVEDRQVRENGGAPLLKANRDLTNDIAAASNGRPAELFGREIYPRCKELYEMRKKWVSITNVINREFVKKRGRKYETDNLKSQFHLKRKALGDPDRDSDKTTVG